jgi:uncharacterized protein (TIGR03905 family)
MERYKPQGVCAGEILYDVKDGVIQKIQVLGGCNGNLKGICKLLEGMPVTEAISRLEGIQCGMKRTSCPDQIAKALKNTL